MEENINYFMIGFFVLSSFVIITGTIYYRKNQKKRLREIAARLGLSYSDGQEAMTPKNMPGQVPAASGQFKALSFLFGLLNTWKITGLYNGIPVEIYTETRGSGKSSTTYTIFNVMFKKPLGLGLAISKEGIFQKMGKALLNSQDIQTGFPEFDDKIIIKGSDEAAVKKLLTSPPVREQVLKLVGKYPGSIISDTGVTFERRGISTREDYYKETLNFLAGVVSAFPS